MYNFEDDDEQNDFDRIAERVHRDEYPFDEDDFLDRDFDNDIQDPL